VTDLPTIALPDDAPDPAAEVAAVEALARRFETPCGDGTMIWRAWGEGPPLLLFHGSHGSWSHWIRSIPVLSRTRTVWAPDLPGYGESALAPEATHESVSAAIEAGVRALIGDAGPVDLAGFSFGGVIAATYAALHPASVRRLVIIGTGGLDTPMGDVYRLQRIRGLEGEALTAALTNNLLVLMLHHPDSVDPLALHLQLSNGLRARLDPVNFVLPDRLIQALPRIAAPLAAIWGEHDGPHPNPPVQEAVIRRYRPDVDFRVIPDAGHWAMYERPEAFHRVLDEVLAG
jgi:pimeloyl-ACP methyl ester carboxylesterase